MILSRSGFELNEIWARQAQLVEADAGLRAAERLHRADPSNKQALEAYHRHLLHASRHDEYMAPHVRSYIHTRNAADAASNEISRKGNWPELREKADKAAADYKEQHDNLHAHAKKTGQPAGTFLPHDKETTPDRDHWNHVSELHNTSGYSGKYHDGPPSKVYYFDNTEDRDAFHQFAHGHASKHYDVKSRSKDEHGSYHDGYSGEREAPHRVEIHERRGGREFDRLPVEQRSGGRPT